MGESVGSFEWCWELLWALGGWSAALGAGERAVSTTNLPSLHLLAAVLSDTTRLCVLLYHKHLQTPLPPLPAHKQLESEQQCISAAMVAAAGDKAAAVRQLSRAVHACPWNAAATVALANAALSAKPRNAHAVYRACPDLLPEQAASSTGQHTAAPAGQDPQQQPRQHMGALADSYCQHSIQDVLAAACSRTTALSSQVAAAVAATSGREVQRLQRLLHALPDSPDLWYCLALAALLQAIGDGQCSHFRKALRCCTNALAAVRRLLPSAAPAQQQGAAAVPAGPSAGATPADGGVSLASCNKQQLQEVEVRLMVAISECQQHSRLPGCHDAAHHWAMDALTAAMQAGPAAAATAHRQVGRMLASEGMVTEAEMAYRQAAAASGGQCPAAQLELAKLLLAQGRQQEAVQLLHTIWQPAAEALPAQQQQQSPAGGVVAEVPLGNSFAEAAALEEALQLADMGQLEAARAAAAAGLRLAVAAGEAAPAAAELVTASVAVEAAAGAPPEALRNLLLEARWAASSAAKSGMALPGTVGTAAAGVGAAVLAQVELRRNKPDKAYDAIGMSFGAWVDHAVPPQLLMAAGELSGELADCAAAVHTAPWMRGAWERLQLAAAAQGRPILID